MDYSKAIVAAPYSVDADSNFSATEYGNMKTMWLHVSEDYAPFDIDVTTTSGVGVT